MEFSEVPELTSSFHPFLCACFDLEAISGILIVSTSGLRYLVLCISSLSSLAVLYLCVPYKSNQAVQNAVAKNRQ